MPQHSPSSIGCVSGLRGVPGLRVVHRTQRHQCDVAVAGTEASILNQQEGSTKRGPKVGVWNQRCESNGPAECFAIWILGSALNFKECYERISSPTRVVGFAVQPLYVCLRLLNILRTCGWRGLSCHDVALEKGGP